MEIDDEIVTIVRLYPNSVKDKCLVGVMPSRMYGSNIDEIIDFGGDMYVICTKYPVGEYAETRRIKHPDLSTQMYPDSESVLVQTITNELKESHPNWPPEYFPREYVPWVSCRGWYNQGGGKAQQE